MEQLHLVSAKNNSPARQGVSQPETRNPRTGLPEQYFYRPITRDQKAAANGLWAMLCIGFAFSAPFWIGALAEWLKGAR